MTTKQYQNWINSLKKRYRATQIKAAVAVNSAMLEFYWSLGADISRMYPGKKRNLNFFENLSNDLCLGIDNPTGLSTRNLKYALAFYQLFSYRQQVVADKALTGDDIKHYQRIIVAPMKTVKATELLDGLCDI